MRTAPGDGRDEFAEMSEIEAAARWDAEEAEEAAKRSAPFDDRYPERLAAEAKAAAARELQRYLSADTPRDGLPDVPMLVGHIDALVKSLAYAWDEAALSQREAEAWELHGQQETFAREKAELGVDGRGLAALREIAVDVALADDLDERGQNVALWGVVRRHTAIAKEALGDS